MTAPAMPATQTYTLSDLAAEITEAAFSCWHVAEGASVREGDDLLDIVTDKATVTIPAPAAGTIIRLLAREEDAVDAATPLFELKK
jgi:pyruvate dehydrogenase E2 component (dihydrolipoamide acetyltransferase)